MRARLCALVSHVMVLGVMGESRDALVHLLCGVNHVSMRARMCALVSHVMLLYISYAACAALHCALARFTRERARERKRLREREKARERDGERESVRAREQRERERERLGRQAYV